ncbi:hypothetical protein PS9374_07192 [Planomonospora sphaerica]|uniref:Uncharacterized protein n=1 Tax=Planomonospora sphaerica TaxID=161355 RepID=A0A171DR22_9ACTN|nr:hypothetical protein PS9374_07192 [Planomonospora sphaerica]
MPPTRLKSMPVTLPDTVVRMAPTISLSGLNPRE